MFASQGLDVSPLRRGIGRKRSVSCTNDSLVIEQRQGSTFDYDAAWWAARCDTLRVLRRACCAGQLWMYVL